MNVSCALLSQYELAVPTKVCPQSFSGCLLLGHNVWFISFQCTWHERILMRKSKKRPSLSSNSRNYGYRECDGWIASPNQWIWVKQTERRWSTGKPGVLWCLGPQSLTQLSDWTTRNGYRNKTRFGAHLHSLLTSRISLEICSSSRKKILEMEH